MTKQGDRRRVALAAALQVALSLVRLVHMNRSLCISQSPVAFWLEAFRGNGKRQGARRPFKWAMIRQGITDLDAAQIIYDAWLCRSQRHELPLDYIVMDPTSGAKMEGTHVQSVLREVAAGFQDPSQQILVRICGFRRFAGALANVMKTPPTDIVSYGGCAGVPELAQIVDQSTEVLQAWEKSMPHLYSDARKESAEIQKLLHRELLRGLIVAGQEVHGAEWIASWEALQDVAMTTHEDAIPLIPCQDRSRG